MKESYIKRLENENKQLKDENRWLYSQLIRLGHELKKRMMKDVI